MKGALATVFVKELRDALRDRRTALMVFFASIITGPVTLVLVAQFISGLEEKAARTSKPHSPDPPANNP